MGHQHARQEREYRGQMVRVTLASRTTNLINARRSLFPSTLRIREFFPGKESRGRKIRNPFIRFVSSRGSLNSFATKKITYYQHGNWFVKPTLSISITRRVAYPLLSRALLRAARTSARDRGEPPVRAHIRIHTCTRPYVKMLF